MATLEEEILDKFRQMDGSQKRHLLSVLVQQIDDAPISLDEWLDIARKLREELQEASGKGQFVGVQAMLDEIREEASWPRH
jgi:hypothetical protein